MIFIASLRKCLVTNIDSTIIIFKIVTFRTDNKVKYTHCCIFELFVNKKAIDHKQKSTEEYKMMLRILTIIFLFHMVNGDKLLSPAQVPNEKRSTNRYRSDEIVEMGTRVVKQQPIINFTGLKQNASVRIHNGIKVESSTEYPFIVAIATVIDEVGYVVCGGTLISPFTILTAAHCAEQADIVSIGIHDFGDGASNAYSEVWDIEEIIVHPAFVLTQKIPENDVALLRIAGPSNFPSIKLDDGNYTENFQGGFDSSINLEDGELLTLAGWGMTEEGFGSSVLLKSTVNYITNGMCKLLWKSHTLITDDMMCTYSSESSGCNGDSGGPLFIEGSPSTDTVQVGKYIYTHMIHTCEQN